MIEVELPDGSVAEFPDGTPPDVMKAAIGKRFAPAQTVAPGKDARELSWGETAMDAAKSLGSGLLSGVEGAVTFPAMAGEWLGEKATGAIDRYVMGRPEQDIEANRAAASDMHSGGIGPQNVVPQVTQALGSGYQPQSTIGDYAKTTGEFLPATVAGGGSMGRKVVSALGAAGGSETAGQMTEGTAAEPYARLAGALLGGSATELARRNPMKAMREAAPSHATVRAQKDAVYKALESAGVKYDANAYGQWAQGLKQTLRINPKLHPRASALMDEIDKHIGKSPDFTDMEWLRVQAGQATRANAMTDAADIAMAGKLLGEIDNFTKGSPLISNGTVSAGDVAMMAGKARELARRNILAREIKEMDRRSQYYLGGSESGQRNQVASYLRSPKGKMLTPAEEKAFARVVKREGIENITHNAGSRLANIGALLSGASSVYTGPVGLIGTGVALGANLGARKLSEIATNRKTSDALKTALAGRKAQATASRAAAALSEERKAALIRALMGEIGGRGGLLPRQGSVSER